MLVSLLVYERAPRQLERWIRATGVREEFLVVSGCRVRILTAGRGSPVVLVHGFGSSAYTWRHVIPGLAARHRVAVLDLPGYGTSELPGEPSLALLAEAVAAVLERMGPPAHLVGSSLGGALAALVASRSPELVERLVLVDAAGYRLRPNERPLPVRLASGRLVGLLARLPLRRIATRWTLRQVFADPGLVTAEMIDEYAAPFFRRGAIESQRRLLGSATPGDVPDLLRAIRCPVLVVWGREDRWIPVEDADRFAADLDDARVVVLEHCGHLPHEERPEEFLAALEGFLQNGHHIGVRSQHDAFGRVATSM